MEVIAVGASRTLLRHFPLHHHGCWEILINLSGSGRMTVADQTFPFQEGDICIIPPETPHEKTSELGFLDLSMMIKEMRPIGERKAKMIADDTQRTIGTLMELAHRIYEGKSAVNPERVPVILNALGEAVYQALAGLFSSNRQKNRNIDGFIERMEANISNPNFCLGEEIEKYGYNRVYFRKIFKAATGESPVSYFNRIRIEYAQKEFHQYGSSRSVKDIALASGFSDPYYFSRVFKKVTGASPTAFQQRIGSFDWNILHESDDDTTS